MAVPAQDGTNSYLGSPDNSTPNTWSLPHTIGAGLTNSALIVLAGSLQGSAPDGATWNGGSMNVTRFTANGTSAFWLLNPTSGTHTLAVHWPTGTRWIAISAITFTNVAAVYINSSDNVSNFATTLSQTITAVGVESLSVNLVMSDASSITQDAGQTEQTNFPSGPLNQVFSSTATKDSGPIGGTITMSEHFNGVNPSDNWGIAIQLYSATRHSIPQMLII